MCSLTIKIRIIIIIFINLDIIIIAFNYSSPLLGRSFLFGSSTALILSSTLSWTLGRIIIAGIAIIIRANVATVFLLIREERAVVYLLTGLSTSRTLCTRSYFLHVIVALFRLKMKNIN